MFTTLQGVNKMQKREQRLHYRPFLTILGLMGPFVVLCFECVYVVPHLTDWVMQDILHALLVGVILAIPVLAAFRMLLFVTHPAITIDYEVDRRNA